MRGVVAILVLAVASQAAADRPIRVDGLPAKIDRAAVDAALDGAFRAMTPCFRRAAGAITVKLAVGADGEVTSAAAVTRASAAQCAAGILAVTRFPAGAAWRAQAVIQPIALETWLTAELGKQQSAIRACQSKDARGAGELVLQLAIAGTGAVTSAAIEKSTAPKSIADCARVAATRIALGPLPGGGAVKYRMALTFTGESKAGTGYPAPDRSRTPPADGGMVSGALAGDTVRATWQKQQARTLSCGAKGKPGNIEIGFKVRGNGTVKNVLVRNTTIDDKKVLACVERAIAALAFPTASGETSVILPLSWK